MKLRSFAEPCPFQIYRSIRSRKILTKAKNQMHIKITVKVLRKSAITNKNKSIKQREEVYEVFLNHRNDRWEKILLKPSVHLSKIGHHE